MDCSLSIADQMRSRKMIMICQIPYDYLQCGIQQYDIPAFELLILSVASEENIVCCISILSVADFKMAIIVTFSKTRMPCCIFPVYPHLNPQTVVFCGLQFMLLLLEIKNSAAKTVNKQTLQRPYMLYFYPLIVMMLVITLAFGVSSLRGPTLNVKEHTTPVLPPCSFYSPLMWRRHIREKGNSPNGT